MSDLTMKEQEAVRTALHFFRAKLGGWGPLGRALHGKPLVLGRVAAGRPVSASVAFRVARLAGISIDDLLSGSGKFVPPGCCPKCGYCNDEVASAR